MYNADLSVQLIGSLLYIMNYQNVFKRKLLSHTFINILKWNLKLI